MLDFLPFRGEYLPHRGMAEQSGVPGPRPPTPPPRRLAHALEKHFRHCGEVTGAEEA